MLYVDISTAFLASIPVPATQSEEVMLDKMVRALWCCAMPYHEVMANVGVGVDPLFGATSLLTLKSSLGVANVQVVGSSEFWLTDPDLVGSVKAFVARYDVLLGGTRG